MRFLVLSLLLACGGRSGAPVEGEQAAVAPAADVPEFAAVNHLGEPRSRADLVGHPTVLWFFPAAGTPG